MIGFAEPVVQLESVPIFGHGWSAASGLVHCTEMTVDPRRLCGHLSAKWTRSGWWT